MAMLEPCLKHPPEDGKKRFVFTSEFVVDIETDDDDSGWSELFDLLSKVADLTINGKTYDDTKEVTPEHPYHHDKLKNK